MPPDSSCRRSSPRPSILGPSPATVPLFAAAVSIISSSSTDAGCLASLHFPLSLGFDFFPSGRSTSIKAILRHSEDLQPRLVAHPLLQATDIPPPFRSHLLTNLSPPARLSPRLARHPRNRITRTDQTSPTEEDKTETKREPSHDQRRQNNQLNWSADERDTAFLCSFCNYMSRAAKTTLAGSIVASGLTVWAVHFMQTQERAVSWVAKMVREGIESNRGD